MTLLISILLTLSVLALVYLKTRSIGMPEEKGAAGERNTSDILYSLAQSNYKVINDVVLQSGGYTTQIDHLVVSAFGIFVIETKNYKGWIMGNEHSEHWTQVLFKRKEKFYNPIWQNSGHIKALKRCLQEYPDIEYISIIVFSARADLKVTASTDVIYLHNLPETIRKYSRINLSETEKEHIYQKLSALNVSHTFNEQEHIRSIRQRIRQREQTIRENRCPGCGGNLVMRNGKYGPFLGCSSYPACRFKRKT